LYEGLLQLGIPSIEEHELQRIFRHFDRDNSGKVTVEELLRGLRVGTLLSWILDQID
jgi:Ca2+-binding EF-hand superfamily protein